jgi:hypothetical protein
MPTQDETPTVEVDIAYTGEQIDAELALWSGRLAMYRKYSEGDCIAAVDRWLDRRIDARGR